MHALSEIRLIQYKENYSQVSVCKIVTLNSFEWKNTEKLNMS